MLLAHLPAALAAHAPKLQDADRRAAVAIVARAGAQGERLDSSGLDGDELLFIHRAEHPLDPWSGHMAFPGGMVDPGDTDPLEAAVRETREELGLDLRATATLLGRLSDVKPRSLRASLSISPFVFAARGELPPLLPNDEVQEAVWVPWRFLADPRNRSTMTWPRPGAPSSGAPSASEPGAPSSGAPSGSQPVAPLVMPCYDLGGRSIWGLTLRMVDELLELLPRTAPV